MSTEAATLPTSRRHPSIGSIASWVVFLAFAVLFVVFRPVALGGFTSFTFVNGVSMEPTLHTGDLAIVIPQATYAVGDIISFRPAVGAQGAIIHRIVGGDAAAGWVVQGDNKDAPDPMTPHADTIVGKDVVTIPGVGWALETLKNPIVLGAIGALLAVSLLWDHLRKRQSAG
ncbi:MAG: signal peptidase I [Chloroflexota bacterium]